MRRRTLTGTLSVALLALAGAVGCGSGGSDGGTTTIAMTPLAGKIAGQAWSAMTGETDTFLSTSTAFDVSLYSDSFTACSGTSTQEIYLSLMVPKATGEYTIATQGDSTAIFVTGGSSNLVASSGHLVVDSVTATTLTGGINVSFNGDNSVDGQFTATICQ